MRGQRDIFQMKEQDEAPGQNPNERNLSDLPDKEFKVMATGNNLVLAQWK